MFYIVKDATVTLTGGAFDPDTGVVIMRTFVSPPAFSVYNTMEFAGVIRCTGEQVVLRLNSVTGDIFVDNPDSTIHFDNTTIRFGGDLYVYDTQRVTGFNATWGIIANRHSKDLYSQNGNALTNWGICNIGSPDYTMTSGSPFTIPGGKYASVFVGYRGHYAGDFWYDISGDIEFIGTNLRGYAVELQRVRLPNGVPAGAGARLGLNGHDLRVTGGGLLQVCEFTVDGTSNTDPIWWNRIEAAGSTVTTDGSIAIGPGGYFTGDLDTRIELEGDWDNRSQWQTNNFTLDSSTLAMAGSAEERDPQLIEAQSRDLGPGPDGMVGNHVIGRLEIGESGNPTHARLVDVDDFCFDGEADVFHAVDLYVHDGSSLDICGLEMYVGGQTVRTRWTQFGAGRVFDSTIPSGSVFLIR